MDSVREVVNKALNLSSDAQEKEEKLELEEKRERKYLEAVYKENPEEEELKDAVDEFLKETKIAKEIAENIFHISEGELYLNQLESEGRFSEHISEIENETEDLESLVRNLLEMVEELDQEGSKLEEVLNSQGIEQGKEFVTAKRRLQKTESILEASIDKGNGFSRRAIIKGSLAAGLGAYWLGKNSSNEYEMSKEIKASKEIFVEYKDRIRQLTKKREFDPELPIAVGERHAPPGDSFSTLNKLLRNRNVSKLGLEFLHRESKAVKHFNQGSVSPEKFAQIYINRSSWPRIKSQLVKVFRYAQENDIEIAGLEYKPVYNPRIKVENYEDQLERSKAMVKIVDEVNDGNSVFLAGSTHVDRRMVINSNLIKNAHPDVATNIKPSKAISRPYVYTEFSESIGVSKEFSKSSKEEARQMYESSKIFTLAGAINSITSVLSTSPSGELHKLNKSLNYLEASNITDMRGIKEEIGQAKEIINDMKSSNGYQTVSSSGYGVYMEPDLEKTPTKPSKSLKV